MKTKLYIKPDEYIAYYKKTSGGDNTSPAFGNTLESFQKVAESLNRLTPQDVGNGIVITSVAMEGTTMVFKVSVPAQLAVNLSYLSYSDLKEMKMNLARSFYGMLNSDVGAYITPLDTMESLGIKFCYQYYDVLTKTNVQTIFITAEDIRDSK